MHSIRTQTVVSLNFQHSISIPQGFLNTAVNDKGLFVQSKNAHCHWIASMICIVLLFQVIHLTRLCNAFCNCCRIFSARCVPMHVLSIIFSRFNIVRFCVMFASCGCWRLLTHWLIHTHVSILYVCVKKSYR